MARIYVASSWRNRWQPETVERLRAAGHEVYDFRNPPHGKGGFRWDHVDQQWQEWTTAQYCEGLQSPVAKSGFDVDYEAMEWADTCVIVLPCGRSAHTEAGWFAGSGRKTIAYIPERQEPELMYRLFDLVSGDLDEIISFLSR
ncbi:MAG: nucleoside 2-deoxyribosyltransferase [Bacteroidales bacterium]|nr:nucleoside 2-deoxyribosyltransferase [Bacteroidales bacterium]